VTARSGTQKLHAHVTVKDCRNHLQPGAAAILIDATGLDGGAPRSLVHQQY